MGLHLHIDPFSGIAGDMFLGALVDLGADPGAVTAAFKPLDVAGTFSLSIDRVQRFGIGAVNLHVVETGHHHKHDHSHGHKHDHTHDHDHGLHPHEHSRHDHGHSHTHHHPPQPKPHHHHTTARDILKMIEQLDTAPRARHRARAIVQKLADAEGRVHNTVPDEVHFHEVGALDSIVDMLGAAVAMELLDIESVSCGLLPLSRGWVKCAHGLMPVPAPATAYLLEGLATQGVDREGELVTPTGAAIVAALATAHGPPPAMTMVGVGYGAGDKQFPEYPNLLRLMLGRRLTPGDLGPVIPHTPAPVAGDTAP